MVLWEYGHYKCETQLNANKIIILSWTENLWIMFQLYRNPPYIKIHGATDASGTELFIGLCNDFIVFRKLWNFSSREFNAKLLKKTRYCWNKGSASPISTSPYNTNYLIWSNVNVLRSGTRLNDMLRCFWCIIPRCSLTGKHKCLKQYSTQEPSNHIKPQKCKINLIMWHNLSTKLLCCRWPSASTECECHCGYFKYFNVMCCTL